MSKENITFGSVCSGIEAASVAWEPLGWRADWLAEIEPFPAAVLKHHYPDTPNHGDMTLLPDMVLNGEIEAPDVLVGGTPCQSFSVAGMRAGLSDERGQLTIKYVELANAIDTIRRRYGKEESIIVWENVPGVLSDKTGAFGCFLGALAGESCELQPPGKRWSNAGFVLGPQRAIAWRILDAQYFGVAQRRRRVFVVASARAGFDPAQVLFEFDSVRRDTAPSRETRKEATGNAGNGIKTASHWDGVENPHPTLSQSHNTGGIGSSNQEIFSQRGAGLVAFGMPGNWIGRKPENGGNSTQFMREIAPNQTATDRHGVIAIQGTVIGRKPENGPQGSGYDDTGVCFTQTAVDRHAVAIGAFKAGQGAAAGGIGFSEYLSPTLTSAESGSNRTPALLYETAVRRLTPIECERLQGFPDGYTQIPWRGKSVEDCPDGHRYKALGNSMAVPVMHWIGSRISQNLSHNNNDQ